jgi:hypothetical protein
LQAQTGKYCRLAQLPSTYPLNRPVTQTSSSKSSKTASSKSSKSSKTASRGLLQVPSSCATQGVLCDLDSPTGATILTYTGYGMSYNGVPLVQSPNSKTLLLSSDPACTVPGGEQMTFPPANLCELHRLVQHGHTQAPAP